MIQNEQEMLSAVDLNDSWIREHNSANFGEEEQKRVNSVWTWMDCFLSFSIPYHSLLLDGFRSIVCLLMHIWGSLPVIWYPISNPLPEFWYGWLCQYFISEFLKHHSLLCAGVQLSMTPNWTFSFNTNLKLGLFVLCIHFVSSERYNISQQHFKLQVEDEKLYRTRNRSTPDTIFPHKYINPGELNTIVCDPKYEQFSRTKHHRLDWY